MDTDNDNHSKSQISQAQNNQCQSQLPLLMTQTSGYQTSVNNSPISRSGETTIPDDFNHSPSIFNGHNKVYLQQHYFEPSSPCSRNVKQASHFGTPIQSPTLQQILTPPPNFRNMSDPQLFSQIPLSLTPDDIIPLSDCIPLRQPSPPQASSLLPQQIYYSPHSQQVFSSSPQQSSFSLVRSTETYMQSEVPQPIVITPYQANRLRDSSTNTDQIVCETVNTNVCAELWTERPSYLSFTEQEIEQLSERIGIEEFNFYQMLYEIRLRNSKDPNMQSAVVQYGDSSSPLEIHNQPFEYCSEVFNFNDVEFDEDLVLPPTP